MIFLFWQGIILSDQNKRMNENELRKKYFFVHFYTWNLAKNHSIIYIYDVLL